LAALGAGCAGQPPPRARVHEAPSVADNTGPAFASPAHWDYHPPAPDGALAWSRLGDGCVFTAEGGQRWTTSSAKSEGEGASSAGACGGKAESSGFLAPEDLINVVRRPDKSWLFIGESGAL